MKKDDLIRLVEKLTIEEVKKYKLRETDFNLHSEPAKKMREFVLSKINANIMSIANWTITKDLESLNEFFKEVSKVSSDKFENYINPENFTDGEIKLLKAFESKLGKKLSISTDLVSLETGTKKSVSIYKKLYSDGRRLAYMAYSINWEGSVERGTKNIAKSAPFPAAKGQSLRELANVLKRVLEITGEQQ